MKKSTLASLALTFAFTPLFAFAASPGVATASGTASSGAGMPAQACLVLTKNLGYGMRGSDVESLQAFLTSKTAYKGGVTGYFGPLTRAAVKEWQTGQGIAATGFIGQISRGVLTCTDDTGGISTSVPFSANPSSGQSPLAVSFTASPKNSGTYIINFGDGTNSGPLQSHCLSSNSEPTEPLTMSCEASASHIYEKAGTYNATLSPYVSCLYNTSGPRCMIAVIMLGQARITVR